MITDNLRQSARQKWSLIANFIQVENGDQTACFIQDFLAIISGLMDILLNKLST